MGTPNLTSIKHLFVTAGIYISSDSDACRLARRWPMHAIPAAWGRVRHSKARRDLRRGVRLDCVDDVLVDKIWSC